MEPQANPEVVCGACGASGTEATPHLAIATCTGCGKVLELAPLVGQPGAQLARAPARGPRFPMPIDAELVDQKGEWFIEVPQRLAGARWMKYAGFVTAVPALFLVFAAGVDLELRLASAALAALAGYTFFQGIKNRMRLLFRDGGVEAAWGPLPWLDSGVRLSNVARFTVKRSVFQSGDEPATWDYQWKLFAESAAGEQLQLLETFDEPFFPHWLQQELEARLAATRSPEP